MVIEDGLTYNEPPDWFFSVRHSLGAVLLQAGRFAEAEVVKIRLDKAWEYVDIELEDSRVKAIAYQNIRQKPNFGSFMVKIPGAVLCSPLDNNSKN